MGDEEIIEVVSALKANDKTMKDSGISDNLWGKAVECILFLQSENASMCGRLERSIELPCIEPMTTYDWDDEKGIGKPHFGERYQLLYRDEDGEFIAYIGLDKEEAEASLAELKGDRNEQN